MKIKNLPVGKYIVCGEALTIKGEVLQSDCFDATISKRDSKSLQSGVKVLIVISMAIVFLVVVYAVLYQVCKKNCTRTPTKK